MSVALSCAVVRKLNLQMMLLSSVRFNQVYSDSDMDAVFPTHGLYLGSPSGWIKTRLGRLRLDRVD